MFNEAKIQSIEFFSNPCLPDETVIVPAEENGRIVNKIQYQPNSSFRSPFEGVHFSRETMSLRSKLNLGVPMEQVSIGQVENDPNVLNRRALHLEHEIVDRLSALAEEPAQPVVEPPFEPNVKSNS